MARPMHSFSDRADTKFTSKYASSLSALNARKLCSAGRNERFRAMSDLVLPALRWMENRLLSVHLHCELHSVNTLSCVYFRQGSVCYSQGPLSP